MSLRTDEAALDHALRVETLLSRLDAEPESETRTTALEAVAALAGLYEEAFRRLIKRAEEWNTARELADDALIAHLLIAHALHPESLHDRVGRALDDVRPYLHSHGGEVELLGVEGDYARVRLQGSCRGCASSADTLRARVQTAVLRFAPELLGIVIDDAPEQTALVQLQRRNHAAPNGNRGDAPRCELCSREIMATHRHLLDLHERRLVCTCPACSTLFAHSEAGGHHYRLVPDRHQKLPAGFVDDAMWAELQIPVDVAFFFHNSTIGRAVAFYPGPAGATESLLGLAAWDALRRRLPLLETLAPDVEALLVCRARGVDHQWIVPVDRCYELTGLMRSHWRGLAGGSELWDAIAQFFEQMERNHG